MVWVWLCINVWELQEPGEWWVTMDLATLVRLLSSDSVVGDVGDK
jgi:hypothetical protein